MPPVSTRNPETARTCNTSLTMDMRASLRFIMRVWSRWMRAEAHAVMGRLPSDVGVGCICVVRWMWSIGVYPVPDTGPTHPPDDHEGQPRERRGPQDVEDEVDADQNLEERGPQEVDVPDGLHTVLFG